MYPARFDYHAPASLEEALELLGRLGSEAKLLAGGASLIPLMKLRLAEPRHVVDLGRVTGLDRIALDDGRARIGAMVRQSDLEASPLARRIAVLGDACAVIADPLVRNVGTIGGNLAHGDPANDQPAVMLALEARLRVAGPRGVRELPIAEFHRDILQTALEPDEILAEVLVPLPGPSTGTAYVKFERQVGDFAIAAAAAVVELRDGRADTVRVAFTNLAPTPVRAPSIESALLRREPSDEAIAEAVRALGDEIDPWDDLRASAAQKRTMAERAAERALRRARDRAGWRER